MPAGILLFGATRGTGLSAAGLLAERGEPITAFVRPDSDMESLTALGANLVVGNVLDAPSVEVAFASGTFRAVITSVGGKRGETPRPDFDGTKNIVDAAKAAGVNRLLMVTAVGSGDSRPVLSDKAWEFLGPAMELKTKAEDYLRASGLDYTILRPGGMNSDPPSGTAIKTVDHTAMGIISRADLGALLVDCLDDADTIGQTYHAIDPKIKELPPLQRGDDLPKSKY